MGLTIHLPDDLADELRREAERHGVEPARFAARIISEGLPAAVRARSLRSLFDQ